jgi:hypothetical protein
MDGESPHRQGPVRSSEIVAEVVVHPCPNLHRLGHLIQAQ